MPMIKVSNLTFSYDNQPDNIFENVSFIIDTNWKLGFIGRNGKGKTTFLNLLLGKYDYEGSILHDVTFDYFPLEVKDNNLTSYEIAKEYIDEYDIWKLEREISLLDLDEEILSRPFKTLSKGEQTKVLLAILFLKDNNFLLIDEPTNHLDVNARRTVANYLNKKSGFILVSHDRSFIDKCVDHILSINRCNIEIQQGNFSSWYENKIRQDNYELSENDRLKKDINRLELAAKQTANWSNKGEASKYNLSDGQIDRGFISHKASKMMKRSKVIQRRQEQEIEEKSKLLKNIETVEDLKLYPLVNRKGHLIEAHNLSINYGDNTILSNINFTLEDGDRLQIKGKNGSGKSSIIKLILGEDISYTGDLFIQSNLVISYVNQETSHLNGSLKDYIKDNDIDEPLFKAVLSKMDFEREQFDKNIDSYSEGQKKKILLAKSICDKANIYIWDEPLNFIDIYSRIQIEKLIKDYKLTMIFVEHDESFSNDVATNTIEL